MTNESLSADVYIGGCGESAKSRFVSIFVSMFVLDDSYHKYYDR